MFAAKHLFGQTSLFNHLEEAEVEIDLFQDGSKIKIKKNVDHHNANSMPIDSHLPQADPFSLVPTFKPKSRDTVPLNIKSFLSFFYFSAIFSQCTIDSFYFLIPRTQKENYNSQSELKKTLLETQISNPSFISLRKR
jgi:hypothetical protein